MQTLGIWLAAFCTLAIYSFLYGDNPVYQFAEHLFVGLGAAHMAVMGWESMRDRALLPVFTKGEWWWLGAVIGGIMLLMRWFKPVRWVSRIPLGFMMGVAAGLSIRRAVDAELWQQIRSTAGMALNSWNNVIYLAVVVCTLAYFIFIYNEKTKFGKAVKGIGVIGQYGMMVAFGASLGATIMARLSLVIARLDFLFKTWLKVLK